MYGTRDFSKAEAEIKVENLATLKKRRTAYRRSFTKAEKVHQDQRARRLDALEGECIQSALNRLEFDVACSQDTQDYIVNNLRKSEHETVKEENEPHEERSADTIKGLKQLMAAVKADRLVQKTTDTIDELTP